MKDFNPLVSCIIPVYNAEKYLDEGIRSLLGQTYGNLEIILVDDQSTDDSWSLCLSYAKKYPNIKAFRNEKNSGTPLRSRERGIKESTGEWITFMDCDDYVGPLYVENLVDATHGGKFDIAVTGHTRLYADGRREDFLWDDYSQTTTERLGTFYQHFLTHDFWTDPTDTSGQNLVKASVCKKTDLSKYSNLVYAEDTLMALAFLANSTNGVNFVDKHDFLWRQVEGSGSHGGFSDRANKTEFFDACRNIFHSQAVYDQIVENTPLISVVVPVYNVERYLADCLNSILDQTYSNIEIIIVNDGTTDGSQGIIDEFQKRDPRIISITQKNKGLNMARAAGSSVAKGDYVSFVDSDDVVHADYLRTLYENLIENDVDISVCGLKNFTNEDKPDIYEATSALRSEQVIKSKKGALKYYFGEIVSAPNVHQMTAWGKLYKAHIIKATDWTLSNYKRHEDNLESLQWYSQAVKGISVQSVQLYFYRKNAESITQTLQMNTNPDGKQMNYFEFIYELYEKIITFVNDDELKLAALNQFAHTNRSQIQKYFSEGQMDTKNMDSATINSGRIIMLYNEQIQKQDDLLSQGDENLRLLEGSSSWRITRPLRVMKQATKRLKRRRP